MVIHLLRAPEGVDPHLEVTALPTHITRYAAADGPTGTALNGNAYVFTNTGIIDRRGRHLYEITEIR